MNIKTFALKIATVAAGAALAVTAISVSPAPRAEASCQPMDPCATPKPNLVMQIENSSCSLYGDGQYHLLLKMRVSNLNNTPAAASQAATYVDGKLADTHNVPGPLWTSTVYHLNLVSTPGWHRVAARADSGNVIAETNETDNGTSLLSVLCS